MKHVYLIICHKNDLTLRTLIEMLDNENNDIFIHVDKKSENWTENDNKQIKSIAKKSLIFFTSRIKVNWGSYSLVAAELILLKTALNNKNYDYFHLLSGQDLPIQTQSTIQKFFEENNGKEMILYQDMLNENGYSDNERVYLYHFLQEKIGKPNGKIGNRILRKCEKKLLDIQRKMPLKRNRDINFKRGPQWFSITKEFAEYIVNNEKWIKKHFKYGYCVDELFVPTLVDNSEFGKRIFNPIDDINKSIRYTDWTRGQPYTFTSEDFQMLVERKEMFARKFDENIDATIIKKLSEKYKEN